MAILLFRLSRNTSGIIFVFCSTLLKQTIVAKAWATTKPVSAFVNTCLTLKLFVPILATFVETISVSPAYVYAT
nr:hypothetical protein [Virgibacillus ndiopensis]